MAVRKWVVETPEPHRVRLEHGFWTGVVVLHVDGELVYRRAWKLLDRGLAQRIVVGTVPVIIRIRASGLGFRYGCRVEDECGQVCQTCGDPFARNVARCPLCGGEGRPVRVLVDF